MSDEIRQMNELINDARELIGSMKTQHEINKSQFEQQKELLDKEIKSIKDSWKVFRNIVMTLVLTIVIPSFIFVGDMRTDLDKIQDKIESEDHLEVQQFLNSVDEMTEQTGDMFETNGAAPEDVAKYTDRVKSGVTRSIGERSRGLTEK